MQKIKRGKGFRGVLNYGFKNSHGILNGELMGGNMSGLDPRALATEFGISRRARQDVDKPVWHNSLRLPAGETMSKDKWCKVADDYMQRMGFTDAHQRVYIMHNEPNGQHIHIVASRIGLDKSLYYGENENLKSTRVIQRLEKAYGLQVTKGPTYENGKLVQPELKNFTAGEYGKSERTGEQPLRYKLAAQIDLALQNQPTAVQFVERLHALGITAKPNFSKETLNGFSFVIDGVPFKGSQLGNQYKGSQLFERGMTYDSAREAETLRTLTGAARSSAVDHGASRAAEVSGLGSVAGDRQSVQRGDSQRDSASEHSAVSVDGGSTHDRQQAAPHAEQSERGTAEADGTDPHPGSATEGHSGQAAGSRHNPGRITDSQPLRDHVPHLEGIDADSGAGPIQTGNKVADELARKAHQASRAAVDKGIRETDRFWAEMAALQLAQEAKKRREGKQRDAANSRAQSHIDRLMSLVAAEIRSVSDRGSKNMMKMIKGFRVDELEVRVVDNRLDVDARKAPIKRIFQVDELIKPRAIGWLKGLNARGQDIYVRPARPEKSGLVLVDDLSHGQVAALEALGLQPAILNETSDQNYQAWIRVNNSGFSREEHAEITQLIHEKIGGDTGSRDQEHFGRLAGFTNRKPSRTLDDGRSPYVLLKRYAGELAPGGADLLQYARERILEAQQAALDAAQAKSIQAAAASEMQLPERAAGAAIPAGWLTTAWQRIEQRVSPQGPADASQIDFRCAIELHRQGVGISEAIRLFDELPLRMRKGGHADDYMLRTVSRAYALADLRAEGRETKNVDLTAEAKRRYPHVFEPVAQPHQAPQVLKTSNAVFAELKAEEARKALEALEQSLEKK
ncbi:TPA: relaxase/mobilization nuclease domain-containing protein [Pseudomonas putida]|uniref:relaxase/mobilization nuclease domain-containing protein n=1 Tax=Pseudomonas putida TaxID=303 RepID=UPI00236402DC|nr:DNA-primase RepB domain-containing protein [Pseudomonas putida]MDD2012831.1 DNA-primase RepB domain-containing protein [Pseudomonas putida]HDS1780279.1 relaxase/mobilization nuclease domain-containing protein [Pseudomonas putida]